MRRGTRVSRLLLILVAGALGLEGCSDAQPSAPAPSAVATAEPDTSQLRASVLQLRHEEGTATLHLHLINEGAAAVEIDSVRLGGPALTTSAARPVVDEARVVQPGQLMTAPTEHDKPDCDGQDQPTVLAVTLADGDEVDVALDDAGQELVDSLVARECGLALIEQSVRIDFLPKWQVREVEGEPAMVGTLALDRTGAGAGTLEVVGLRGSVLLDFVAVPAERVPFELGTEQQSARVPVALVPAGRCDGHALSQSRQTFLLSVFLQLEGQPEQRLILPPSIGVQDRVLALVRRTCGI